MFKPISILLLAVISFSIGKAEEILLNAEDDWAPYSSMTTDKKEVQGFSPEIVTAAFKAEKVDVKFRVVPYARCMKETLDGDVIGCFDSVLDEQTKSNHIHHKTPLFETTVAIWASATSSETDASLKTLEGSTVGVTNGYNYPQSFTENSLIKKDSSTTELAVLEKVAAGYLKYGIVYEMPGYYQLKAHPELAKKVKLIGILSKEPIYLSFSKKHPKGQHYANVFEKGLKKIKKNGTYKKIEDRFKKSLDFPVLPNSKKK